MDDERERVRVRRRDRAQGDEWIRAFLRRASSGHLATVAEGQPYLNSNLFVYDEDRHAIYMHTARTGRTPSNIDAGGAVAFSATVMGRLLPAATALDFSVEYASVVVFGSGHPVEAEAEKRHALQMLLAKYAPHLRPGRDYRPITAEELRRTAVHRVEIEAWSGKEKVADSDFAGAFMPPDLRPPVVAATESPEGGSE